ncbi:MAG: aldehyde dehydrogenase [Pseudomonadota bacterium]
MRRLLLVLTVLAPAVAPAAAEEFGVLYPDQGAEETYYTCAACHSERLVAQQGLTRHAWDELIDWMVEDQGMAEPDAELRTTILDYLSTHYNTDRPHFPLR